MEDATKDIEQRHELPFDVGQYTIAIAQDPSNAQLYFDLGNAMYHASRYEDAVKNYGKALLLDPDLPLALCRRADLRATCPVARWRSGDAAISDAAAALTLAEDAGLLNEDWKHRAFLAVMAAAFAEAGDFGSALATEHESYDLAITNTSRERIGLRMEGYANGRPTRVPAGVFGHWRCSIHSFITVSSKGD